MIVVFPLLVSRNVKAPIAQGVAIILEQYIAAYALDDFVGKNKEFNKYYDFKIRRGKVFKESSSTWFDLDPLTKRILTEQDQLNEIIYDPYGNPIRSGKGGPQTRKPKKRRGKKRATKVGKHEQTPVDQLEKHQKSMEDIKKAIEDLRNNRDIETKDKQLEKPAFSKASISDLSINLAPTWVTVQSKEGEQKLGLKVVPMMIEGFNIKHTISRDMQKWFLGR